MLLSRIAKPIVCAMLMICSWLIFMISYGIISFYDTFKDYTRRQNLYGINQVSKLDDVAIVTFAGGKPAFYLNKFLFEVASHDVGIDRILSYSSRDIDQEFYRKHASIMNQPRGYGYWLWKPYIILDAMKRMPENSIIFYIDNDIMLIGDMTLLINAARHHNRVLFKYKEQERLWTKRDAFILMGRDHKTYYDQYQTEGNAAIFKNNEANRQFVAKWLKWAQDPRISTDLPSTLGSELPEFIENRHEQTALSLLTSFYQNQIFIAHDDQERFFLKYNSKNIYSSLFVFNRYMQRFLNPSTIPTPYKTPELNSPHLQAH